MDVGRKPMDTSTPYTIATNWEYMGQWTWCFTILLKSFNGGDNILPAATSKYERRIPSATSDSFADEDCIE